MERIISEIKTTADKVAKKSTELVELSKVKLNIANTKSNINENFRILGEMIYISQKHDEEIDADVFSDAITKIDELYLKLAEYNETAAALMNKKLCPECRKANENTAVFCSQCGYRFADDE
jgi:hypothetical protein